MSNLARIVFVAALLAAASPALAADGDAHAPARPVPATAARAGPCEHGVARSLCARCNTKLAAVYKAKGDWCAEHERPESQCVLCHPELARKGVK